MARWDLDHVRRVHQTGTPSQRVACCGWDAGIAQLGPNRAPPLARSRPGRDQIPDRLVRMFPRWTRLPYGASTIQKLDRITLA
jgi:hypothetical protein